MRAATCTPTCMSTRTCQVGEAYHRVANSQSVCARRTWRACGARGVRPKSPVVVVVIVMPVFVRVTLRVVVIAVVAVVVVVWVLVIPAHAGVIPALAACVR